MPLLKSDKIVIVWPVLHGQIGIGKNIINHMFDIINRDIEKMSRQELALRELIPWLELLLDKACLSRDVWRDSKDGGKLLYNITDKILQKHGRDFPGVKIMKLMENAAEIMDEICKALIENKSDDCNLSNVKIEQFCFNIKLALTLWDGVFSAISAKKFRLMLIVIRLKRKLTWHLLLR